MVLLALVACTRCPAPEISDPGGTLDADTHAELQGVIDDFVAWTEGDDLCIDQVVMTDEVTDWEVQVRPWRTRLGLDPSTENLEFALRAALCGVLDYRRGLAEPFAAVDGTRPEEFSHVCGLGPPDAGWLDQVVAACGTTSLDEVDRWLLTEVWTDLPPARVDGDLGLTVGDPVHVEGIAPDGGVIADVDAAGSRIGVVTWGPRGDSWAYELVLLDPAAGTVVAAVPMLLDEWFHGGPDVGVIAAYEGGVQRLTVVDPATGEVGESVTTTTGVPEDEVAVGGGRMYGSAGAGPLYVADLGTGAVEEVEMPWTEPPYVATVIGLAEASGGVYVRTIEVAPDAADVYRGWFWDSATWTEVPFALADPTGTGTGAILGTLPGDAGTVVGLYDPGADRLYVSDDLCVDTWGWSSLVTGGVAWRLPTFGEGTGVVLTPVTVARNQTFD